VSSSTVRDALAAGDMAAVATLLGRPYSISGHVLHGKKLGRELGFRTLNLRFHHPRPAALGIFVVRTHGLADAPVDGVASLGRRPSVDDSGRVLLEVHCLTWPRALGRWTSTPHVQVGVPLPRRGVAGRITGAGFDVSGNGKGKHFGDTSVTIGWDLTYEPWHVSVDLGTALSQMLLERPNHEGVQQNWMLYARRDF